MPTCKVSQRKVQALLKRVQDDITYLRDNLDFVITAEYETELLQDLEMFLLEDIAREIRISLYNPDEDNRVYIEFRYLPAEASSGAPRGMPGKDHRLADIPQSCMFDIFLYFSPWFKKLDSDQTREIVKNCNIDWFNLDIDLTYNEKSSCGKRAQKKRETSQGLFKEKQKPSDALKKNGDPGSDFTQDVQRGLNEGQKLFFVIYKDLDKAVDALSQVLQQHKKISVRWSVSRGFFPHENIEDTDIEEINKTYDTLSPGTALNFIIENEENQVSYIFEDFHHHMGDVSSLSTKTAEIRSRIRDLSRALRARDEYVFILAPTDSLPIELVPLFHLVRQKGASDSSLLSRYGYDMTGHADKNMNKPLVGRDDKKKRVLQTLCQMETNNPLLVGEPGVGKTAIVEALAKELSVGNVPSLLKGYRLFSLNLNSLVAGSKYRGDFEERIHGILEEVQSHNGRLIVFIDEIHTLLGTGSTEGASGAEDILKPALARGDFPCIGATTYEGYQILLQDPALARRFKKIDIPPATEEESKEILLGIKSIFEKHHEVTIQDEAIDTAVQLSRQYMQDQFLPGKAIKLLDSASAFVKLDGRNRIRSEDVEDEIAQCGAE